MTQKPQGQKILERCGTNPATVTQVSNDEMRALAGYIDDKGVNHVTRYGIHDICAAVDASQTPAVVKATLFSEALCRLERMKGEYEQLGRNILAQDDRVAELQIEMQNAAIAEYKRVQEAGR